MTLIRTCISTASPVEERKTCVCPFMGCCCCCRPSSTFSGSLITPFGSLWFVSFYSLGSPPPLSLAPCIPLFGPLPQLCWASWPSLFDSLALSLWLLAPLSLTPCTLPPLQRTGILKKETRSCLRNSLVLIVIRILLLILICVCFGWLASNQT